MKHILLLAMIVIFIAGTIVRAQDFNPSAITFIPQNLVEFKLNLPIVHLDVNNYVPSIRGLYAGQNVTFRFYGRNYPWTNTALFMRVRWDTDLDARNGVTWSDWFQNETEDAFASVIKNFSTPGKYTITFEIEFYVVDGSQTYSRVKEYDLTVAPMPTAVYEDPRHNKLFYWEGVDGVYDKPAFLVEGFDPDNSNTPEINYGLGYDLIEQARSQGYDVFIMEWADGGADLSANKDVFLGACQFLHNKLNGAEAAVQVVGISMGGIIVRYALAYAEDNIRAHPGQYIEHHTNTFVSFDAPQQGAHFNTGLQKFIRDNGNTAQKAVLQSTAAKQMLYDDVFDKQHDVFYSLVKSLHNDDPSFNITNGYPRRCKNFAVSNGNRNADYPLYTTNNQLATLRIYVNVLIADILTLPGTQKVEYIFAEQRDLWPGSTFAHDLTKLYSAGHKYIPNLGLSLLFTNAFASWLFEVNFNPSYTPTESALDMEGYTRATDGSLIGGTSWFDDVLMQSTFHRHEELTSDSKDKVMSWLNTNRTSPYLGKPGNVAATALSYTQVKLVFTDQSAFEEGSIIERKTIGGTYSQVATLGSNVAQFTDYCVNPNTSYLYRVRSYKGNLFSVYSDDAAITTPPVGNIQAPANLVAAGQPNYVSLTWSPVSGVTGYRVYRSTQGQSCPNFSIDVTGNSYLDILPGSGQQYTYRVTAINTTTEGVISNASVAAPLHLSSQTLTALGTNSQRKFVEGISSGFSTLYQTYESGGASFLTWSTNNGDTWSNEVSIGGYPSPARSNKNPTLVMNTSGSNVEALYDALDIGTGSHTLRFGEYSFASNQVNTLAILDNVHASSTFDMLPVATWTTPTQSQPALLVYAYRKNTTYGVFKGFGLGTFYQPWPFLPSFTFVNFDLTTALSDFPLAAPSSISVAANVRNEGGGMKYAFYIVWAEDGANGGIKFARGLYTWQFPLLAGNVQWDSAKAFRIVSNTPDETNINPAIAIDGAGNVFISWEYRNLSSQQGNIKVQKRSGGYAWLPVVATYTFPNVSGVANYPHAPSIVDYRASNTKPQDLTLVWYTDSPQYGGTYCANYTGASQAWSAPACIDPDGRQASVQSTGAVTGITPRAIFMDVSGPPFAIRKVDLPPTLPPASPTLSWTSVSAGVANHPKLVWNKTAANILANRVYRYYCSYGSGDCGEEGQLIYVGPETTFTDMAVVVYSKSSKQLPTTAYYYVTASNSVDEASQPSNKVAVNTANIVWKAGGRISKEEDIPAETKLIANYPNPFNPSTVFRYQLSAAGRVTIIVYNTLGQEIEYLVDARQDPGYYTAVWNVRSLSSGVYYARMNVVDDSGKEVYHEIKKLLYTK